MSALRVWPQQRSNAVEMQDADSPIEAAKAAGLRYVSDARELRPEELAVLAFLEQ